LRVSGSAVAWWQQLKQSRVQQGKTKINSREKLLKHMRATSCPITMCGPCTNNFKTLGKVLDL